jgi:hypothetical protein
VPTTDREKLQLLRATNVGPLHWSPPPGIDRELDGSRYNGDVGGFQIKNWGTHSQGRTPDIVNRRLSPTQARTLAGLLDEAFTYRQDRNKFTSAVAWVDAILALLPEVLQDSIELMEGKAIELRQLKAMAEGLSAGLAARTPIDEAVSDRDLGF